MDRNASDPAVPVARRTSLSARRAWIEMASDPAVPVARRVALRKESVDRNVCALQVFSIGQVALRKESVDRNRSLRGVILETLEGRSPQGERG